LRRDPPDTALLGCVRRFRSMKFERAHDNAPFRLVKGDIDRHRRRGRQYPSFRMAMFLDNIQQCVDYVGLLHIRVLRGKHGRQNVVSEIGRHMIS
jgi:hypothetical protein